MVAGKLNRQITFNEWEYTQDDYGGVTAALATSWNQFANVVTTSGNQFGGEGVQQWQYDAKFTVRKLKQIKSNHTITYDGANYTINDIRVTNEGKQEFYEIRASKTDGKL